MTKQERNPAGKEIIGERSGSKGRSQGSPRPRNRKLRYFRRTCTSSSKSPRSSVHHRRAHTDTKGPRKKSLPERHRYQVEKRRKMQGIQIAAPSLATSWKNRRGSRYVAKVVIGGEKRRYVQCRFSRRFFGFFREIFFGGLLAVS